MDSLKQQIKQMQALKINGIYVLNSSQRNILDDVLEKVADYVTIPRENVPRKTVLRIAKKFCVGHPMNELCKLLLGENHES